MSKTSLPRSEKTDPDGDTVLLAALGYKQEFRRVFHPIELFGVVVSVLCIGPEIGRAHV